MLSNTNVPYLALISFLAGRLDNRMLVPTAPIELVSSRSLRSEIKATAGAPTPKMRLARRSLYIVGFIS